MKAYSFNCFVAFVLVFLVLLLGFGVLSVSMNPQLFEQVIQNLNENSKVLKQIGWSLIGSSLFLFYLMYQVNKKSMYQVQLDEQLYVSTEKTILSRYLSEFLDKELEKKKFSFDLKLKLDQIEIILDLSKISLQQHEALLETLEPKIMEGLTQRFGPPKKVIVSVLCAKA